MHKILDCIYVRQYPVIVIMRRHAEFAPNKWIFVDTLSAGFLVNYEGIAKR